MHKIVEASPFADQKHFDPSVSQNPLEFDAVEQLRFPSTFECPVIATAL